MRILLVWCLLPLLLPGQSKPTPPPAASHRTVQFDSRGWPIVAEDSAPSPSAAPAGETGKAAPAVGPGLTATESATSQPVGPSDVREGAPTAISQGVALGSPLLEVFQATRTPGAFKALGGRSIWWRATIYGSDGTVIGLRDVTHIADSNFAERDRLEFADGRTYARNGGSVYAERAGMPLPTMLDEATTTLMLFGLHWRLPWCFGDSGAYVVTARDSIVRGGQGLNRLVLERRPPAEFEVAGPEFDPKPRDQFELLYEPGSGTPLEFVHRFAVSRPASPQTRRVLLEDWRDYEGVRLPYRRVYVDDNERQTTTLEILRIEASSSSERDFRRR